MAHRPFLKTVLTVLLATSALLARGGTFTSSDGAFTLDMPSGWTDVKTPPAGSVLSIQKKSSRIDVKTADCTTETCIEGKINADLADVKRKKMQVVGNTYTGEEIKRIEFSTGEPFFYISFFTPKNDFGAGYFLINGKAYSILAKDLTYAETDLIFSFISPRKTEEETPSLEMAVNDPRAYNIAALPAVAEATLSAPVEADAHAKEKTAETKPAPKTAQKPGVFAKLKKQFANVKLTTLLSSNMPPYVRKMGHGFDALIALAFLFAGLQLAALAVRLFVRRQTPDAPANPNSLYPIRFTRLYGTPSLIFRAKDNQGNILISLSARWDSLFLFTGLTIVGLTFLTLAAAGICENARLLPLNAFTYNTLYSACSLAIPLGVLIFFCGVVWSQLVLREITLFDRKGQKAAVVLQKGFGLLQERYEIYFARSKDVLTVTRKRFSMRRRWKLFDREGHLLAEITETSALRSVLRKLCGHLWGFLRADYNVAGQMDSCGHIQNAHAAFDRFTCTLDKPQALNARDMLAVSLLINIRDNDKWYPWFN